MKKPIIELKNAWKIYNIGKVKVPALKGISLKIYSGDIAIIMGASGSGKSTAMNLIGCLDLPTKGTIKIDGKDISKMSENKLAKIRGQKIGFVFQRFNLIHSLNAIENVILPMIFQGNSSNSERIKRAKKILNSVGLIDRIYHRPNEMSGGEQQRVAIARALANNPEVILADEPTGNLDSITGKKIINMLRKLHEKDNKTIIIVTHDINIANQAKGKIYELKDGEIIK